MIRNLFIILAALNWANAFLVDRSAVGGGRIRETRAFVATASRTLVDDSTSTCTTPSVSPATGRPKIVSLDGEDDYEDFLQEDDRLVMIK